MVKTVVCFQVLKLINITTEVSMLKINENDFVEVLEYDQVHISFEAENRSCQPGHLVKLTGAIHFEEGPVSVVFLGKVTKTVTQANQKVKVTVELRSYDQELWKRFTSFLAKRQEDLDKLFNLMRDAE
ncbi:MAG TPA: hypothetical protein VN132_15675 [Bdellovibrio sp.]|nr:hypothetical protein [Bdellovibrio sp.]